jgi:Mini-chromosome maintenance replisome factor
MLHGYCPNSEFFLQMISDLQQEAISNPRDLIVQKEAISNPRDFIAQNGAACVKDLFPSVVAIPSLNDNGLDLPSNTLVRWDCFVQDNSLPYEVYPKIAKAVNTVTGEVREINLDYCDAPAHPWQIEDQSFSDVPFSDKQPHICVSIPGQSTWAEGSDLTSAFASLSIANPDNTFFSNYLASKCPLKQGLVVNVKVSPLKDRLMAAKPSISTNSFDS